MSLDNYHKTCCWRLSRSYSISTDASVKLGAIYCCTLVTQFDNADEVNADEIACFPDRKFEDEGWTIGSAILGQTIRGQTRENGWTRFDSGDTIRWKSIHRDMDRPWPEEGQIWLAQANHIFNHLNITSNYENYVFVSTVHYWLRISMPRDNTPSGYLFLCPLADLQSDIPTSFRNPDCAAYWSLDPSGVERLSTYDAIHLGFPTTRLEMDVSGRSWDGSVYTGLRQFHQGKGFDPYTQDLARHMGYPLYQISDKVSPGKDGGDEFVQKGSSVDISIINTSDLCGLADAETFLPSRSWNIIMAIQFALIMILSEFSLYDYLLAHCTQATD
ncbi:hypothetical protein DFH07DRAFT_448402 [Mycena maculata]|uniref:Uncharacterized protein n=1 Tax=Mycena maculata TaxID=230809 RepID=A0AAD7NG40_9AGAR|nr:hypothetical protein DFH07DRAFT_448402 [Mycena maculata]